MTVSNAVQAQQPSTYVYATISYDQATNQVNASMYAAPDYGNYVYMRSGISANIHDSAGNVIQQLSAQSGGGSGPVVNYQGPGNGCGNYDISGAAWIYYTYYVYQNNQSGYYTPFNYAYTSESDPPSFDFFYRQSYPQYPDITQSSFRLIGTIKSFSDTVCAANDISFKTANSSSNGATANFDSFYTATLNIAGGVEVCGTNRSEFNLTVDFELPYDANSIITDQNLRTYVSDFDDQQFQELSHHFEDVDFLYKRGKIVIVVRRTVPSRPSNKLHIRIEGTRANGPNYSGVAVVKLICP